MGLRERIKAKIEQLYEKRRNIDNQIELLLSLTVGEEKNKPKKVKKSAVSKLKRTPMLGEIIDDYPEIKPKKKKKSGKNMQLTRDMLFKTLSKFNKKGATFAQLLDAVNYDRKPNDQIKSSKISTMMSHIFSSGKFKDKITRQQLPNTKGSKALYRYFYIGPKIK